MTDLGGRIGERIRERRKSAGMLQEDLAKLMRVQSETVGRWENGQHPPKYNRLPDIAEALGVSVLWLIATDAEIEALSLVEQVFAMPEAARDVILRCIRAHMMREEDVELAIRVSKAPPEIRAQMQRIIDALDPLGEPPAN